MKEEAKDRRDDTLETTPFQQLMKLCAEQGSLGREFLGGVMSTEHVVSDMLKAQISAWVLSPNYLKDRRMHLGVEALQAILDNMDDKIAIEGINSLRVLTEE